MRPNTGNQLPASRRIKRRRGIALVLILGMLAITIAVSYSLMRLQTQTILLQNNAQTNELARRAAEAGLVQAIRKMHFDAWSGVGTTLTGNFDSQSSYSVSYTAGDASLTSGSPDYAEYPYRVTVTSTGTALNNGDSALPTSYTMTAVLRLVRQSLNSTATPSRWSTLNGYTCYQWNSDSSAHDVDLELPFQIEGNSCFLGKLRLAKDCIDDSSARQRYLQDLKLMKDETARDYRPFTGTVALGMGRQDSGTSGELTGWLGLTVNTAAPVNSNPVNYVNAPATYRLYPGGPVYSVGSLSGSQIGQTIAPNVLTNPLGIYKATGAVKIRNGTKLTGVLFHDSTTDDIQLEGTGNEIHGVNLLIDGQSQTYQLPAAMVRNDLQFDDGAGATVRGLVMVWDEFRVREGSQANVFNLQGRLFANYLDFDARTQWNDVGSWTIAHLEFQLQYITVLGIYVSGVKYFPDWLDQSSYNLDAPPKITLKPPSGISYHWPDWTQPIYTKGSGESGLRWNIVSWRDGS